MCDQHQRTKKRDRADEKEYKAGVSTFHTAMGRNWYSWYSEVRRLENKIYGFRR